MRSKYETNVQPRFKEIREWIQSGMIELHVAKKLGISEATFSNYKNKYPELLQLLNEAKIVPDQQVEDSLFKRAIGYLYEEETRELMLNPLTMERELVITKTVTKQVVPDVTAQIFWLKNRRPDRWRDKQDINLNGQINNPLEGLTTEELKRLAKDG
ncbi:MAG: helix-turn-helix domain-containing protein [Erysipelothrix sp.]